MSHYETTKARIFQWLGIILIVAVFAGSYWYFNVRAGVTINRSQNDSLTDGLVGLWSFNGDDISGTTAYDRSGSGNNGTLIDDPIKVIGKVGQALEFVWSYVELGSSVKIDNSSQGTLSAWVYYSSDPSASGSPTIFSYGGGTATNPGTFKLQIRTSGGNKLSIAQRSNGGATLDRITGSTILSANRWYHVAAVSNGTSYTLYVDGMPEQLTVNLGSNTGDWFADTTVSETDKSVLGVDYSNNSFDANFGGRIDEFRTYNRALSATEIQSLYNQGGGVTINRSQNDSLTDGLVGLWSFNGDDISGTTAYDRSGAGNNGTLTGGPVVTPGKVGQALDFDGTDDYVQTGSATLTGDTSYCLWVYYRTANANYSNLIIQNGTPYRQFYIEANDTIRFYTTTNGSVNFAVTMPKNIWKHLCISISGTTGILYMDGVAVSTKTINLSSITAGFQIGRWTGGSTATDASLDEVRIYNRALSATEIQSLYALGQSDKINSSASQPQGTGNLDSGLAGYWKLDENTGTSAVDSSTNGNTGTLTDGPTWTTGQIGSAVNFDGTNDWITMGAANALDDLPKLTYSAWVNPGSFVYGAVGQIGMKGHGNGTQNNSMFNGWQIGFDTYYGNSQFSFGHAFSSGTNLFKRAAIGTFTTGSWQHVTVTWDGTNLASGVRIYKNGVEVASYAASQDGIGTRVSDSTNNFVVGRDGYGDNDYLGAIDEIRVYSRVLSADEIAQLSRLNSPTGTDTSLKGYWSFNGKDLVGTTAYDRSGSGNNGTLTNGPTITPGKLGQALRFDGTDDYVDLGNPDAVRPEFPFTASAWVRPQDLSEAVVFLTSSDVGTRGIHSGFSLIINADGSITGQTGSNSGLCTSSSRKSYTTSAGLVTEGNWYHIAIVFTSISDFKIFLNGSSQSVTSSGSSAVIAYATNNKLRMGVFYNRCDQSTHYMQYDLDEPRLYNRALTATEIQVLYSQSR